MNIIANNLLSLILFSPILVALVISLLPREEEKLIRWVAFLGSLIPLALSLVLWFSFKADQLQLSRWGGWSLFDDGLIDHLAHPAVDPGLL